MGAVNIESPSLADLSQEALEARLALLCRRYAATEYQLLCCIRECERRGGCLGHGLKSTAHWLNARFGIALGAAREKVRVAHALETLPKISEAFASGDLSYSKVRAVTRVATPANEDDLLEVAGRHTASDLERLCAEYRRLERIDDPERLLAQRRFRELGWRWDDEGMLVIEGRLPPEDGALFIKLVESMRDHLYRQARPAQSGDAESAGSGAAGGGELLDGDACREADLVLPVAARRLDALLRLVESGSRGEPKAYTGAERVLAVLHVQVKEGDEGSGAAEDVPAETSSSDPVVGAAGSFAAEPREHTDRRVVVERALSHHARLEPGTVVSAETARRLCCEASRLLMVENGHGEPLSVGRQSRTVPWHLRRALEHRDRGCTFPGCTEQVYVDAHHIQHWADGGETSLTNLTLLCRRHHRLVHEERFGCERDETGGVVFRHPDGSLVPGVGGHADRAGTPLPVCLAGAAGERVESGAGCGAR